MVDVFKICECGWRGSTGDAHACRLGAAALSLKSNGHVPQIAWGKDFKKFDSAHKIEFLKKLASAMNHAADVIQQERDAALVKLGTAAKSLEHAQRALNIQKTVTLNNLISSNEETQRLSAQIIGLQKELRELKG